MSWVFMAGDRVYKLKKPVRFAYLDFSTLDRREAACRAEDLLNRRLAPDVYLGVVPLTLSTSGLAISGDGPVVDWLVVMRRLEENETLEAALRGGWLKSSQVDRVAATLGAFYAHAPRVQLAPECYLVAWRKAINDNCRVLFDARFGLPQGEVERIAQVQRRFAHEMRCPAARKDPREAVRRCTWRPAPRARLAARARDDHRLPGIRRQTAGARSAR